MALSAPPTAWLQLVNQPQTEAEVAALRCCIHRGRPFGDPDWVTDAAKRLGLECTVRPPWKTEESIVGLPPLLVLSAFSRFGGCHLSPLWHVVLPLSRRALAAAWCVAFVLGFGELPATNLLQPPGITTITFRIWTSLHTGVESHLAGVALVTLAVLAIAALSAVLGLRLLLSSDR